MSSEQDGRESLFSDVEAHLLAVGSELSQGESQEDGHASTGGPSGSSRWRRPRLLFLGNLVLFSLALIPRLSGLRQFAWAHVTDFWDEDIIKANPHAKETGLCGYYGCGKSKFGKCGCDDNCMSDGTCCKDYHAVCKVASAKNTDKGKDGSCEHYGCSKVYRYDHTCQCVPSCKTFDDCCTDFQSHCGANATTERAPSKEEEPKLQRAFVPRAYVSEGSKHKHEAFAKRRKASLDLLRWQAVRSCPPQFMDKTILGGKQIAKLSRVPSAAECQKACTDHGTTCDGFVWAMSGACVLSELKEDLPMMTIQDGTIAGMPCCRPGLSNKESSKVLTDCPEALTDADITTNAGLEDISGVKSPYKCQEACSKSAACGAFSWTSTTQMCRLKKLEASETAKIVVKAGFVSGLPCGCRATPANALWPASDVERFTMPLPRGQTVAKPGSLLCLALMVPYSYEAGLLIMQYQHHVGIFSCDEYQVYSSQAFVLAPGLETRKVLTSQQCEVGGEFKSALNLRIFASFWRQVISEGQYLLYNWIVKADPDTVFFPDRLRPILKQHEEGSMSQSSPGVYFNNCKFGMHGPLEIFSVATVRALSSSFQGCYEMFQKLCNGDCQWGEDIWVDQCLKRFVQAKRVFNAKLLSEAHCDPSPGWQDCKDPSRVAFHPFKTVADHEICQRSSESVAEFASLK